MSGRGSARDRGSGTRGLGIDVSPVVSVTVSTQTIRVKQNSLRVTQRCFSVRSQVPERGLESELRSTIVDLRTKVGFRVYRSPNRKVSG